MSDPVFTSSQFSAFAGAIRQRESSDNYSDTKNSARLGAYQLGIPALEDAGFLAKREGLTEIAQIKEADWTPYARSLGINSIATFLSNHNAQDTAFQNYAQKTGNTWITIGRILGTQLTGLP